MFPLNHLPELPSGPLLFVALAVIIIASSVPPLGIMIPAEPIVVGVILATNYRVSVPDLLAITMGAAVFGDIVSYWLGRTFGPKLLTTTIVRRSRKHILGAHRKVESRGALGAMLIQRWVPPARGFVPAMLGTVRQPFGRFLGYSVIAAAVWAVVFILGAHFGGRTLILAIPTVATLVIAIQVTRRLVFWRRGRRSRRLAAAS